MTPESVVQLLGGGLMAAVAVGMGIEKVRGWLAVTAPAPRETWAPPPPHRAGSLLDADHAALAGRVEVLEQIIAELRRNSEQAAADAARKALAGELRRLAGEMRGEREKKSDGIRESKT